MGLITFISENIKNRRIGKIQRMLRTNDLCSIDSLKYGLTIKVFDGTASVVNNPILQQTKKNTYKAVTSMALGYSFIVVDIVKSLLAPAPYGDNGKRVFPVPGFIVNNITEFGDYGMLIISATCVDDGHTYIFVRNIFEMSQLWGLTCISSTYLRLPTSQSMWMSFLDQGVDGSDTPTKFVALRINAPETFRDHEVVDYVFTDSVDIRIGKLLCETNQLSLLSIDLLEKVMAYPRDHELAHPHLSDVLQYVRGGLTVEDMYY